MKNCPTCSVLCKIAKVQNTVHIYSCRNCHMVFAHDQTDRIETEIIDTNPDFYEATINGFDLQVEMARRILPARIKEYESLLGRKLKNVLEVGCGVGAYAAAYNECNIRYTAVEIEPEIARHAREKTQADIRCEDFADFVPDVEYDVVFASQVLEHVREPKPFLENVRQVSPNGLLHLDVPNHNSVVAMARKLFSRSEYGFIQPPHHMLAYTAQSMKYLLSDNGFHEIEVIAHRNDHPVWGQLIASSSLSSKVIYYFAGMLGRGSLLMALARIKKREYSQVNVQS